MQSEIAEFIEFHRVRVLRKTGKSPAPATLKTKASRLRVSCDVAHAERLVDLATIITERERVELLLDGLSLRQTSGTMQSTVDTLRDFGAFSVAKGWITEHEVRPSDRPPANPQKPITIYTPEEIDLLLTCARAKGLRWWMFLHTLIGTGRRVGEVLGMEYSWLNTTAETPHIHLPYTKNGRQAYVPLSRALVDGVWTDPNIAALQGERRTGGGRGFGRDLATYPFPWSYPCVHGMFQRYCVALGVESRAFHCMRHTKATNMLAKGVPIQAVSALLGHASVQTTDRIYNHATALSYSQYID